jgi:hypothetical protein
VLRLELTTFALGLLQNTQHYHAAYNYHGSGFKSRSLPLAPLDMEPVCYIADLNGTTVLGYEEGNGGDLLPCPSALGAYPYTEAQITNATDEELKTMCNACYQSVCTFNNREDPRDCGNSWHSGVDVGEDGARGAQNPIQVRSDTCTSRFRFLKPSVHFGHHQICIILYTLRNLVA